jgi:hypothetical protein
MSEPILLQIIMQSNDLQKLKFDGRDQIEDPLQKALSDRSLGEVSGGGSGGGVTIVDVDISKEENLAQGLKLIRQILQDIVVPPSTVIKQTHPFDAVFEVYDQGPEQ